MRLRIFLILGLLFSPVAAEEYVLPSEIPLGAAYDGRMLWVSDARTRKILGFDMNEKKQLPEKTVKTSALRDLAFWKEYVVSAVPGFILIINPINGDVVEKKSVPTVKDPVCTAISGNMLHIYDRARSEFVRYDLNKEEFYGNFKVSVAEPRGAAFYRGYLWIVDKDGKANKINPDSGDALAFVPLPENSYGIDFVDGRLFVTMPGKIQSVDYIETDTYVAASQQNWQISFDIHVKPLWNPADLEKEGSASVTFRVFPVNPHQRIRAIRFSDNLKTSRRDDGDTQITENFLPKESAKKRSGGFSVITSDLTWYLSRESILQYFSSGPVPDHVFEFLETGKNEKAGEMFRDWKGRGSHPWQMLVYAAEKKLSRADTIRFLRLEGVPARDTVFCDLKNRKKLNLLQLYIKPLGWVTITDAWDKRSPKQFPLANSLIEVQTITATRSKPAVKAPGDAVEVEITAAEREK